MSSLWHWFCFVVIAFIIVKAIERINYLYNLVNGLSDDINDIKKKLGLSVEKRTKRQLEESNQHFIYKQVLKGQTLKDLRRTFGFWGFRKYKWYIENCLNDYPERKICPKCEKLYSKYADGCYECKDSGSYYGELVPFNKYKEEHPEVQGWVNDYE